MTPLETQAPILVAFISIFTPIVLFVVSLYERFIRKSEKREDAAMERADKAQGQNELLVRQQVELSRNQTDLTGIVKEQSRRMEDIERKIDALLIQAQQRREST